MESVRNMVYVAWMLAVVYAGLLIVADGQLAWSPILVDSESQVDLWTRAAKGCACPWLEKDSDKGDKSCACCVREGGCPCGHAAPGRCTQCGLEDDCAFMCNITLDSRELQASSGRAFGQIKSPSLQGPTTCRYSLRPAPGQRVELQVYRLVSVGKFNGTSCEGGYLQLGEAGAQLCGANERYSPPAVLFSDHGATTLILQINETTVRSQFLAYFSFTSLSNPTVGFHPKGGNRVQNTECDWLYQDFACSAPGSCALASPGFPGIYPPTQVCRYHLTTSSVHTRVKINFRALLLPHNHCDTHYLALYGGSSTSAPLLATVCGSRKNELLFPGPNLLLEFRSGYQVPPFDYNGFSATLEFLEGPTSTIPPPPPPTATPTADPQTGTGAAIGAPSPIIELSVPSRSGCDVVFSETDARSGHFDTRGRNYGPTCRLIFKGRPTDVVHVSLFNYRLRSPSCRSVIEVVDGSGDSADPRSSVKSLHKMCSPVVRHARDPAGHFLEPQAFVSTGPTLTVILRRAAVHPTTNEIEFVDGAFLFHDEEQGGTLQPLSMCDAHYYGLSSPPAGTVGGPGAGHLFWNVEGPLRCSHHFIPAANQSVTLTVQSLDHLAGSEHCETACGDGGCHCVTNLLPLSQMDHLQLLDEDGAPLSCFCGSFRSEWLPVSVRTWTALQVRYSVAHYSWSASGFAFKADFKFDNDGICGQRTFTTHSGELSSINISTSSFNSFYHQRCTWILDSNVERQLFVEMTTEQSRSCAAWNVSVHEFAASEEAGHVGPLLHVFCPRDKHKVYSLPWKLNTVVIRVQAMTRTAPVYTVKWRSQVVRANTRLGSPTPAPNAVSGAPRIVDLFATLLTSVSYHLYHNVPHL